jgi:hypothetical protein
MSNRRYSTPIFERLTARSLRYRTISGQLHVSSASRHGCLGP